MNQRVGASGRGDGALAEPDGIAEAWIVDLNHATIEVYREPHFTGYGSKTVLRAGDEAKPLAFPDAVVNVTELLKQ